MVALTLVGAIRDTLSVAVVPGVLVGGVGGAS